MLFVVFIMGVNLTIHETDCEFCQHHKILTTTGCGFRKNTDATQAQGLFCNGAWARHQERRINSNQRENALILCGRVWE